MLVDKWVSVLYNLAMNEYKETPLDLPYDPSEKMLTSEQAAEYLGVSMVTIGRYLNLRKNALPSYRFSNRIVRIKKVDLDKWVEERRGTSRDYKKSEFRLGNYK